MDILKGSLSGILGELFIFAECLMLDWQICCNLKFPDFEIGNWALHERVPSMWDAAVPVATRSAGQCGATVWCWKLGFPIVRVIAGGVMHNDLEYQELSCIY